MDTLCKLFKREIKTAYSGHSRSVLLIVPLVAPKDLYNIGRILI